MADAGRSRFRRPPARRLGVLAAVWVVMAGGALGIAAALDDPVGAGERDVSQPLAPEGADAPSRAETAPEGEAAEAPREDLQLPPLALVLDRPPPAAVAALEPRQQVVRLRELAEDGPPRRWVELGSLLQALGDGVGARSAYDAALGAAPGDVAAEVGLALVEGATGAGGLERAARRLDRLAADNPRSQIVAFNRAWVDFHRLDADGARTGLRRVVALGSQTRLGLAATALLEALDQGALGAAP